MRPFRYPSQPHERRHGPNGYADAEGFRPWLRDEFDFRCVYCLYREQWGRLKGAFAIDHFLPVSIHPERELSYDNLIYACAACNLAKSVAIVPDPTQELLDMAVRVLPDGHLEGTTREARRIIRMLGLNGSEEREARLLWIGIISLAERCDAVLYRRLMGYPEELPNLRRLRPPSGNSREDGVELSFHEKRQAGLLPDVY